MQAVGRGPPFEWNGHLVGMASGIEAMAALRRPRGDECMARWQEVLILHSAPRTAHHIMRRALSFVLHDGMPHGDYRCIELRPCADVVDEHEASRCDFHPHPLGRALAQAPPVPATETVAYFEVLWCSPPACQRVWTLEIVVALQRKKSRRSHRWRHLAERVQRDPPF